MILGYFMSNMNLSATMSIIETALMYVICPQIFGVFYAERARYFF